MTTKELIRAEIERLKSKYRHNGLWTSSFQSDLAMAKIESMNELLSFLDTLPDESITSCNELAEAAEKYADGPECSWVGTSALEQAFIAGAKWGAEHLAGVRKMISDDLGEAAIDFADNARKALYSKDYAISSIADYDHGCIDGFKAGAEWQKRKMMEGAVEGVVYRYESYQRIATAIIVDVPKESLGNKVRIIILPEED